MRELLNKFEEWTMTSLVLLSVFSVFAGHSLFSETHIHAAKFGFTCGLVLLLSMGSLCLLVSRLQSVVAFWILMVLSTSFLVIAPIVILWGVLAPVLTIILLVLIACYFRGISFILTNGYLSSKMVI